MKRIIVTITLVAAAAWILASPAVLNSVMSSQVPRGHADGLILLNGFRTSR
jgi:hypothetical protein